MAKKKQSSGEVSGVAVRPPIVTVVGHVDHGKTTLLDTIRHTDVAAGEHGGITQHIGAYQIAVKPKGKKSPERLITFIDTPGHEAFAEMRSRGAQVADIAIIVVAADDSVKPQTVESVEQVKKASIPFIIAANKIDLEGANLQKLKQDLAKIGVQVEGFGGDVPMVPLSAKTGKGVDDLLEVILLLADMNPLNADAGADAEGVVIETRIDKGKGTVATVIVKQGTFRYGTTLYDGQEQAVRIRAMFDEYGKGVMEAVPGKPVEILGFSRLPAVGSTLTGKPGEVRPAPAVTGPETDGQDELPDFLKPVEEKRELKVVLKADTAGSLEAVTQALPEEINVVSSGVGGIGEADVLLAKSTEAFVIGFNVKATHEAEKLAETERVVLRRYSIIYELLDELQEVAEGIAEVLDKEREMGSGVVIAEFPFDDQRVAGTKVVTGRLARGDTVKLLREDKEISRAKIRSIRQGKNEVNKVEEGQECGILFEKRVDFLLNDAIIAVSHL